MSADSTDILPDWPTISREIRCIVCGNQDADAFSIGYRKSDCTIVTCRKCSFHFIPPYYRKSMDYSHYKSSDTITQVAAGDIWLKIQRNLLRYRLIKKYVSAGCLFDIGCGFGHFLLAGKQLGYEVDGIETSRTNVQFIREQLGLSIKEGDFLQLHQEQTYDLITLWDVLEHIDRADLVVEKAAKMLSPGGYVVLQVPQWDSFFARLLAGAWWAMGLDHVNYFSKKSITRLLAQNGFTIKDIRSSLELKNVLLYVIIPKLQRKHRTRTWTTAERQKSFNRITLRPLWLRKIMMSFHNLLYYTLSFLHVGDEMIVVAQISKKIDET